MLRFALTALAVFAATLTCAAQVSPFSAAVTVNDRAVTYWEIDQRARFLALVNAPGDLAARARTDLINERLQLAEAERLGVTATAEELEEGLIEFAARVNLSADQFISEIEARGVAGQTFRDFVFAGISWRNVLRSQFGPRAQVTEEEVDRALALAGGSGGARVLIAEIVIPITPQTEGEVRQLITQLSQTTDGSVDAFSAAARQYSAAQSAAVGGSLGYQPLSNLPEGLRSLVLPLPPGGVTEPVPLGNAVAIFQLRDFEETGFVSPEVIAVDYAIVPIPGGRSEAALSEASRLRDDLDTCDDLYGVRPGGFERAALPIEDVPADISTELAALDADEVSVDLTLPDGALMFLMLCGRTTELPEGSREEIRRALFNQRLESYAEGLLAELRADAFIIEAE